MTEVCEHSDNAIITPTGVLTRHSHHQILYMLGYRRTTWILAVLRSVEFQSDETPIPGQDSVRLGNAGQIAKRLTSQSFSELGERDPLWVGKPQPRGQFGSQNLVLRGE